ncbi:uncharacterized protein BX664DRAFT_323945 [Halteromyces radiatus]|uniref:uncharacterized protein n=1 Tax=Halteromyces radiatus TaxID=101107 RepID=UPI00221E5EA6|nr:uncharacterized protein BX664DRAFT_323945 [Halteromyces radiatus]KAI8096415.1 hypothetical protein BX664DRAFT_323945 [Halteromyces radiatus]
MFSKSILTITLVVLALFQLVHGSVFSQLQFIKIKSPKNNDVFEAGEKVHVEYIMQPLIYKSTSMGRALSLGIHFHSRTGNQKQQKLATVSNSCPVTASENKFVTHKTTWTIPKNTKPGSYAFDFDENVQVRSGRLQVKETIKVSVVEK